MTLPAKTTSILLTRALASLIPAWLGLYWVLYISAPDTATLLFRPGILAISVALFLAWSGLPVTLAEQRLTGILALLCTVMLATSLAAADPGRAIQEWVKLVLICLTSVMTCRALRNAATAKTFGISLVLASSLVAALLAVTYLRYMGPVLPTYTAVRNFKGMALPLGIPLNPIGFSCLFSYICGMCLLRGTKLLWSLGLVLLVISSALTGSRTPLAALLVGGIVLLTINAVRSRQLVIWCTGWLLAAALFLAAPVAIANLSFKQMSNITESRWDVWSVAVERSMERPILGYGYLSWYEAVADHLPAAHLESGGYHNEFLTALAEQGVVGFIALVSLFWFLIGYCWRLAFRRSHTWHNGQWALFGCIVLLLRAGVEVPGLFGYAQEPADFLAYIFLAIVVSRISVEEDYLRSRNVNPVHSSATLLLRCGSGTAAETTSA